MFRSLWGDPANRRRLRTAVLALSGPMAIGAFSVPAAADPGLFRDNAVAAISSSERAENAAAGCPVVTDMMEARPTAENWDVGRMKPRNRFASQSAKRKEGKAALVISLDRQDATNGSSGYKHELRIANSKRCDFGREVWYSFSFRIEGKYPRTGSTRWVITQWKEETGGSPFLAQRFDNGVFHISVQCDRKRVIVAQAAGDYDRTQAFAQDASGIDVYRDAIMRLRVERLPFIAKPENYGKPECVRVEPSKDPILPDPSLRWVDMRYRVKGDRNGNGIIEVWADGRHIVRVTGKIGNDNFGGPTQYFKVGHYRNTDSAFKWSKLYFDRFKRGRKRTDVD